MTDARPSQTRPSQDRPARWTPPVTLAAPKPPGGFHYRYVTTDVRGNPDGASASRRFQEGYEPVAADDHPDFRGPRLANGGIGQGGLMLVKIPDEFAEQRNDYYAKKTRGVSDAVETTFYGENDPRSPTLTMSRKSHTTKGRPARFDA